MFKQATRKQSKLRMTIDGPAGSGKTYTGLRFAHTLANGGKIAAIDTERGSMSKYVGEAPDDVPWAFDVVELQSFSPEKYTELIQMAGKMGYSVLFIDSLSHAWEGKEGALEIKQKVGDSWSSWRHVTPIHNRMIDAILQSPMHVITTMRSRMEYVQEKDETTGKIEIKKVGLAPIQRPGMEYEFDIVCDIDWAHLMKVTKSRCPAIADMTVEKPGPLFMQPVLAWLSGGEEYTAPAPVFEPAAAPAVTQQPASITLDDLISMFGAEAVLAANEGKIPGTDEEVAVVATKLTTVESAQ